MATPSEEMQSYLRTMAAALEGDNPEAFRTLYNAFERMRVEYPELMTNDELRGARAGYDNAPVSLPCGVQDAIANARHRVRKEMDRRGLR